MHAMDEFLDRIMYGDNSSANTTYLRRIRQELKNCIAELKSLHESKDRVDISLKEYEELKRVNKDLLARLNHAEGILGMLNIPADMIQNINHYSVRWYSSDFMSPEYGGRKHRFRIEFETEEYI